MQTVSVRSANIRPRHVACSLCMLLLADKDHSCFGFREQLLARHEAIEQMTARRVWPLVKDTCTSLTNSADIFDDNA